MNTRVSFCAALLLVMLAAQSEEASMQFAVTLRTAVAMEKLPYAGPYTFKDADGSEVYFSSCGFAKITYEIAPLLGTWEDYEGRRTRRETYQYFMGEFCETHRALFEESADRGPHLIAYYERAHDKYLSYAALIFQDQDEHLYVADPEFLKVAGLEKLARPIAHGARDGGCYTPESGEHDVSGRVPVGDRLCFTSGVYLTDLANRAGARNRGARHVG